MAGTSYYAEDDLWLKQTFHDPPCKSSAGPGCVLGKITLTQGYSPLDQGTAFFLRTYPRWVKPPPVLEEVTNKWEQWELKWQLNRQRIQRRCYLDLEVGNLGVLWRCQEDLKEKFALNEGALKFAQQPIKENRHQCDPKMERQSQAGSALGSPFQRLRHCLLPWPVHSSAPVGCTKQQPRLGSVIP